MVKEKDILGVCSHTESKSEGFGHLDCWLFWPVSGEMLCFFFRMPTKFATWQPYFFQNMRTWLTHNVKSRTVRQWTTLCIRPIFFSFWNDMLLYCYSNGLTSFLWQIPTPGICDWSSRILHWNGSATKPLTISAWRLWIWHSYGHICISTCHTHHCRLLILWTSVARQVCYCHKQFRLDSKAKTSQKACNSMYLPNLSYFMNWSSLVNKLLALACADCRKGINYPKSRLRVKYLVQKIWAYIQV